jgi:hypothetical protein
MKDLQPTSGILAEFHDEDSLRSACITARRAGFTRLDALLPHPVAGLEEALGASDRPIPLCALIGGIFGGSGAYLLQYYLCVINFPINVGGRPLHSWPSFIPVTFEMTILFSGLFIIAGFLCSCRLPQPYHPLFALPEFSLCAEKFYLLLETDKNNHEQAATFARSIAAKAVYELPC